MKRLVLFVFLFFCLNAHADVIACSKEFATNINTINAQINPKAEDKNHNKTDTTKKHKPVKKSKNTSGYYGVFKLLIPDILR